MICLRCGHYIEADRELAREQRSDDCACRCHGAARARRRYQDAITGKNPRDTRRLIEGLRNDKGR